MTTSPALTEHLRNLARLRRVRDRIDREFAQPLDVVPLARGVSMSVGHLSRRFELAYGESPYSYLMTRRIGRGTALLRRGDVRVTEVCFAVGCSSLGTFSSRSTESVGTPPSVYRPQAAADRVAAGIPPYVEKRRAPCPTSRDRQRSHDTREVIGSQRVPGSTRVRSPPSTAGSASSHAASRPGARRTSWPTAS